MTEYSWLNVNMLALSSTQPLLSVKLGRIEASERLFIQESRTGLPVPVIEREGRHFRLHSSIDPEREGRRFYSSAPYGGYLVFLGFGAGYHILPFLERSDVSGITIIEYDAAVFKSLLMKMDCRKFILDRRVRFLVDPEPREILRDMLDNYLPAVSGNLHLLQLRSRVQLDDEIFNIARKKINEVIQSISEDYSVQSYFGKRWFINSLENLKVAQDSTTTLRPVRKALITAAGPSLEEQLPLLREQRREGTLIATDTSLPFLLKKDIVPDMVVSIDCQHITYHHFMSGYPEGVPLVLDLASPNHLTRQAEKLVFFTSGHPFSRYVNSNWRRFPYIDTSGGNVGHAAVSLAETLGAQSIHLFGADFSFPEGKSYARETYLYPYFHTRSGRISGLENHFFSFLLKNKTIIKIKEDDYIRYTTRPMISYKERLEEAIKKLNSAVVQIPGKGEYIEAYPGKQEGRRSSIIGTLFSAGAVEKPWYEFLQNYRNLLEKLPPPGESLSDYRLQLTKEQQDIMTTLFPASAAIRREQELRDIHKGGATILSDVIEWSVRMIDTQLNDRG
jgi:hypothetical protein